jgi:hypothetical protein
MLTQLNRTYSLLRRSTGFICLLFFTTELSAQSLAVDNIPSLFNEFSKKNLQEKIYTHTDKDLYVTGEIVWFKLYNVSAGSNKPLDLSKIAYAEIIDKDQKPVLQAKISLDKGSGSGSFQLPVSLPSGIYQIRAYTNWMKNYDPEYFFEKSLTIVNALTKPEKLAVLNNAGYDIQFFPEGGNLVEGLKSKVAFRATDSNGTGIELTGAVIDENADTLARFKSLKYGIGNFSLTPASGKTYRAVIKVAGQAGIIKQLPEVDKAGYVMFLSETQDSKLQLSVQSSEPSAEQLFLLVHTRQETKISQKIALTQGRAEMIVDKDKLGDGISHLTVFNAAGRPVCERLYFKKPEGKLLINVVPDQQQYSSRKKVTLNLEYGQLTDADASIAVYANSGDADPSDISSYLWLKSDLKGNVEDPGYYLRNNDVQSRQATDNLMLTHGWRRFVWNDILTGKPLPGEFLPEIEGNIISGRISDLRTNSPAANIMGYLSVPGKRLQLYAATSNASGDVKFFTKGIIGPAELVAQTNTMLDSTYRIDIFSPFSERYSKSIAPAFALPGQFRERILSQSINSQVQNTYVGNKLNTFFASGADSSAFYLKPDKTYLLDNFVRFNTMEEVLREYVVEVIVNRQRENYLLWVGFRNPRSESIINVEPLIVFDGVPIFDRGTKIVKYDPRKIQSIEIVNRKYYHGPLRFNSIINFKSYKGNLPDFQLDNKATIMDYDGPQLQREFYAPLYDTPGQVQGRTPDFRNLLYWSPDVKIDASGKKTLSFYTSDQKSTYTIVVQGITAGGKPGSTMINIDVK